MTGQDFWQKLGNTFQQIGYGLTQTAITGFALKNRIGCCHGPSIFCGGFGYGVREGIGIPSYMMADPLGFSWLPNPIFSYNINNSYGNILAYQSGLNFAPIQLPQITIPPLTQNLQPAANEYAGDLDLNQETNAGQAFDEATNKLGENDSESYTIIDEFSDPDNAEKCADEYKSSVSSIAKSYAAFIDKISGNCDGKVTAKEFVKHEISKLPSDTGSLEKSQAISMAQNAFKKIDINGDGYADWKELSATIAAFDTSTANQSDSLNAQINAEDYKKWSALLAQSVPNQFDVTIRKTYTQLFSTKE